MINWIFLLLAILLETAGQFSMKATAGLTRLLPTVVVALFYATSFCSESLALKGMDLSFAYAIWTGLGMTTIVLVGFFFFGEKMTLFKIASIGLILVGSVCLTWSDIRT